MAFELPPLPYARDALSPHISASTLDFHYGKHHKGYVDKLNDAIKGASYERLTLVDVIQKSWEEKDDSVFNNAAQTWNHTFYWSSLAPEGGGSPRGDVRSAIEKAFGSYDGFKKEFSQAGESQFGSGYAWLVAKGGKLEIRKTPNAETPLTDPKATPILTMDVWEHAYYLDRQNRRAEYVAIFLERLVSWDFANANLARA